MTPQVAWPHPGEILLHEFLEPIGLTQHRLAKEIGVSPRRIGEIVAGTRSITVDTGLRLSKFFGTSDGFWAGLQFDCDTAIAKERMADVLAQIRRFEYEPAQ